MYLSFIGDGGSFSGDVEAKMFKIVSGSCIADCSCWCGDCKLSLVISKIINVQVFIWYDNMLFFQSEL